MTGILLFKIGATYTLLFVICAIAYHTDFIDDQSSIWLRRIGASLLIISILGIIITLFMAIWIL